MAARLQARRAVACSPKPRQQQQHGGGRLQRLRLTAAHSLAAADGPKSGLAASTSHAALAPCMYRLPLAAMVVHRNNRCTLSARARRTDTAPAPHEQPAQARRKAGKQLATQHQQPASPPGAPNTAEAAEAAKEQRSKSLNNRTATSSSSDSHSSSFNDSQDAPAPWLQHGDALGGPDSKWVVWEQRNARIHYVAKGHAGPRVLLVHGFGVGEYHFGRNMDDLAKDHRVWAVDLLGQGASWPLAPVDKRASHSVVSFGLNACFSVAHVRFASGPAVTHHDYSCPALL